MNPVTLRPLHLVLVLAVAGCGTSRAGMPSSTSAASTTTVSSIVAGGPPDLDIRTIEELSVSSDRIEGAVERAWSVLPSVYRELGIPIGSMDDETRVLGNEGFRVQGKLGDTRLSSFLRCGRSMTGDHADAYDVAMAVLTQVVEDEDGTVVSTHVNASATPASVSGHAVRCGTTGRLEERIAQRVELRALGVD